MIERDYFTVQETSLTIPRSGALAIFAGDMPRKNADGSTSHSLRAPLLLMPQELWTDADETLEKIAKLLNDNAHLFFDSAKAKELAPELRDVLAEAEEMADRLLNEHDAFSGHAADTIKSLIATVTAEVERRKRAEELAQRAVAVAEKANERRLAAEADLHRALPCSTWQPISTVPMNGSLVDLWSLEGRRICGCNAAVYDLAKFSHWMRAPKPPASIDKGAA